MKISQVSYQFRPFDHTVRGTQSKETKGRRVSGGESRQAYRAGWKSGDPHQLRLDSDSYLEDPDIDFTESDIESFVSQRMPDGQLVAEEQVIYPSLTGEDPLGDGLSDDVYRWGMRKMSYEFSLDAIDELFLRKVHYCHRVLAIYEGLPHGRRNRLAESVLSASHLTVAEALIYYELSSGDWDGSPVAVSLFVSNLPDTKGELSVTVQMRQWPDRQKVWVLHYDLAMLRCRIFEAGRCEGQVRYVVRDNRLEEIEGTYREHRLLLDPIWHPSKDNELRQERIEIAGMKAELTYHRQVEHGVWHSDMVKQKMDVSVPAPVQFNEAIRVSEKRVRFGSFSGRIKWVFVKGILMPVGGHMLWLPSK